MTKWIFIACNWLLKVHDSSSTIICCLSAGGWHQFLQLNNNLLELDSHFLMKDKVTQQKRVKCLLLRTCSIDWLPLFIMLLEMDMLFYFVKNSYTKMQWIYIISCMFTDIGVSNQVLTGFCKYAFILYTRPNKQNCVFRATVS